VVFRSGQWREDSRDQKMIDVKSRGSLENLPIQIALGVKFLRISKYIPVRLGKISTSTDPCNLSYLPTPHPGE
jgi:hypothetical protein